MAEYIDKLQIGTGEETPIRDSEAHELLGEHATTLEGHMLNTNNPHGVTWQQVGAAPAGLLSEKRYITSRAEFETMLMDIFNSMEIGTVKLLQSDLTSGDNVIPNGYWYITIGKRASGIGYIEMTKTTGLSIRRDMMDSVWGEWTHASRLYGNEYSISSLDETDAILTDVVNDLETYGSRFIMFNYNGQLFGCTVYRGSGDYSWAHADSYTISHDYKMHRILYGGVWQPWEYENPPMVAGVEYCTMERWVGRTVKTKLVSLGSFTGSKLIPLGDAYCNYIRANASAIYTNYFEKLPDSAITSYTANTGLMYLNIDVGSKTPLDVYVQMWYS